MHTHIWIQYNAMLIILLHKNHYWQIGSLNSAFSTSYSLTITANQPSFGHHQPKTLGSSRQINQASLGTKYVVPRSIIIMTYCTFFTVLYCVVTPFNILCLIHTLSSLSFTKLLRKPGLPCSTISTKPFQNWITSPIC